MKRWIIIFLLGLAITRPAFAQFDTCSHFKEWEAYSPDDPHIAKEIYDTLRLYIESCAAKDNDSYSAFSPLSAAAGVLSQADPTLLDNYRDWLISVLYLNTTNSAYYCNCLYSMTTTYTSQGEYARFINAPLAILQYFMTTGRCNGAGIVQQYQDGIDYRRRHGQDTTVPPLDSIGLGFLLHQNAVNPSLPLPKEYLVSFTSNPNPFKQETTLEFLLNRMAYIAVDVYDVLGHKVWGSDHGSVMDAGVHQIRIDGAGMSSGTYYARISTGFGEVKTVKLVKE
jgi:hypothetical protein